MKPCQEEKIKERNIRWLHSLIRAVEPKCGNPPAPFDKGGAANRLHSPEAGTMEPAKKIKTVKIFAFLVCVFGIWSLSFGFAQAGWTSGKFGAAIQFDGINDYVSSNSSLAAASAFSYSLWFKSSDGTFAADEYLFSQGTNDPSVYLESTDNKVKIMADGADILSSVKTVNDTQWHHLEITADGTNIKLYLDGALESSAAYAGSSAAGILYVASNSTPGSYFGGIIDDVKVYSYARTSDEVLTDYNDGKAAHLGKNNQRDDGLVGYWNFEEGTGQTVFDRSGNSNNGTLGASTSVAKDDPVFTSGYSSAGAGGTGLKFDGVDDYVDAGTDKTSFKMANNSFSVSGWVKGVNNTDTNRAAIFGVRAATSTSRYGVQIRGSNGVIDATIIDDNGVQSPNTNSTANYLDGSWHFITLVVDRTNNILQLYGDGIATGSAIDISTVTGAISPQEKAVIGTTVFGTTTYFSGSIDEVRIYNRALSADEIRQHYNQKKPMLDMKFDEGSGTVAHDESFNNNDGTLTGATHLPTWTAGKYGSALTFDGTEDYVDAGNEANLNVKNQITAEAWIYMTGGSGSRTILTKYNSYYFQIATNKLNVYLYGTTTPGWHISTSTVQPNIWQHIAFVYNGTDVQFYINGVRDSNVSATSGNVTSDTGSLVIGDLSKYGLTRAFQGSIDSVRIYNYARTQDEILTDYNDGKAAHLGKNNQRDDGLVGYWNMEEGTGQTVFDRSGNSNNGTLGASTSVAKDDPVFTGGYSSAGAGGTGLKFDGVDDYVDALDSNSLDIAGDKITLEVWIYMRSYSTTTGRKSGVIGKGNSYGMDIRENGQLVYNQSGWGASTRIIPSNKWVHLVITKNGADIGEEVKFYIDGTFDNAISYSTAIVTNNSAFTTGYNSWSGSLTYFNGSIDEVRIYNRALSADEIRQHYNQKKPILDMKFDEGSGQKAYDESFNNNDGWLGGTSAAEASDPTWVSGKFGGALSFDGTDDYVDAGNGASLDFTSNQISIMQWFKAPALQTTFPALVVKGTIVGAATDSYFTRLSNSGNDRLFGGGIYTNSLTQIYSTTPVNDNKWHYGSLVYDGAVIKIYVDGILENSISKTGNINSVSSNLILGIGQSYRFSGSIDDVRIYSYARTPAEILVDYNNGVAGRLR